MSCLDRLVVALLSELSTVVFCIRLVRKRNWWRSTSVGARRANLTPAVWGTVTPLKGSTWTGFFGEYLRCPSIPWSNFPVKQVCFGTGFHPSTPNGGLKNINVLKSYSTMVDLVDLVDLVDGSKHVCFGPGERRREGHLRRGGRRADQGDGGQGLTAERQLSPAGGGVGDPSGELKLKKLSFCSLSDHKTILGDFWWLFLELERVGSLFLWTDFFLAWWLLETSYYGSKIGDMAWYHHCGVVMGSVSVFAEVQKPRQRRWEERGADSKLVWSVQTPICGSLFLQVFFPEDFTWLNLNPSIVIPGYRVTLGFVFSHWKDLELTGVHGWSHGSS